jgi:restriction system protein
LGECIIANYGGEWQESPQGLAILIRTKAPTVPQGLRPITSSAAEGSMHNSSHTAQLAARLAAQHASAASTWTAILANQVHQQRVHALAATISKTDFPVLLSQAVIIPYKKTEEGELIKSATFPLLAIIQRIIDDPSLMYEVDPRKWEEIIAATYAESGLFDEVTLTPRSGDRGRDVIAVKSGFGSVRLIESVKRYTPGNKTTAEEVQALLGALFGDPQASKGIVSTTWEFAPMIWENPQIMQYIPHRLELVDGKALVQRLKEYTILNKKERNKRTS